MAEKEVIGKITFLGPRLSFASLFEMNEQKQDDGTIRSTWKANFLFPKDKLASMVAVYKGKRMPALDAMRAAKAEVMEKKWGPKDKQPKIKPDRVWTRKAGTAIRAAGISRRTPSRLTARRS
jgi:hypothetical protein